MDLFKREPTCLCGSTDTNAVPPQSGHIIVITLEPSTYSTFLEANESDLRGSLEKLMIILIVN